MIAALDIAQQLRDLLNSEVDAHCEDGRLRVLTPFEYPDGDGVVVYVEEAPDGRYVVSDRGAADATLVGTLGARKIRRPAAEIARRCDAVFDGGQLITTVAGRAEIADACQRIASAAVSLAEASTFLRHKATKGLEFVDVIAGTLHKHKVEVESEHPLKGASGHSYTATLFVPGTETVIEPIGGERAWNLASAVYVEFGDLSQVNGYRLMAVLDDRDADLNPAVSNLLSQVADVAYWQQHDSWIAEVVSRPGT